MKIVLFFAFFVLSLEGHVLQERSEETFQNNDLKPELPILLHRIKRQISENNNNTTVNESNTTISQPKETTESIKTTTIKTTTTESTTTDSPSTVTSSTTEQTKNVSVEYIPVYHTVVLKEDCDEKYLPSIYHNPYETVYEMPAYEPYFYSKIDDTYIPYESSYGQPSYDTEYYHNYYQEVYKPSYEIPYETTYDVETF